MLTARAREKSGLDERIIACLRFVAGVTGAFSISAHLAPAAFRDDNRNARQSK
jgi:hypothetical protein